MLRSDHSIPAVICRDQYISEIFTNSGITELVHPPECITFPHFMKSYEKLIHTVHPAA